MSASTRLQLILGRILTSIEMYNLRQAIHIGARGLITGKYSEKSIENTATKICKFIEGAHLDEVRKLESELEIVFVEICRDLIVKTVLEEVSMIGGWAALFERERGEKGEEVSGASLKEIL